MWCTLMKQSTVWPSPSLPAVTGQPELLTQKSYLMSCAALCKMGRQKFPFVCEVKVGRWRVVSPRCYMQHLRCEAIPFPRSSGDGKGAEMFVFKVCFAWQIIHRENLRDHTFICKHGVCDFFLI